MLVRPPGWPFHLSLLALALLTLWGSSSLGDDPLGAFAFGVLGLAGMCLVWVVRLGLALLFDRRWSWAWLVLPLVIGVSIGLVEVDAPLKIRFHFAQPAFERAMAGNSTPKHAGTYTVLDRVDLGARTLFVTDYTFEGEAGFVYVPPGSPGDAISTPEGTFALRHLAGRWYVTSGTGGD